MVELVILGAGGNALDIIEIIEELNRIEKRFEILGFLDDDEKIIGESFLGYKVLGRLLDSTLFNKNVCFILSIGSEKSFKVKNKIYNKLDLDVTRFPNIIHPNVIISNTSSLGYGNIVFPNSIIHSNVEIGNFNIFLSNTIINHDCNIGSFVTCASSVNFAGGVTIKDSCFIGMGSSFKNNLLIDEYTLIGMGSVVLSDSEKDDILIGNPARRK